MCANATIFKFKYMIYFTIKLKYLLSLCLFLLTTVVYSQKKIKSIYVADAATKVPVQDAFVQNEDLSFNVSADENGFVSFKNLPASVNKLIITCIGFESKTIDVSTLSGDNNPSIIYLEAKVSSLEEINVRATANNGVFKTISDLYIHLRPINNSQEVLRMVPGLFVGQHAGGGKAEQIF